MLAVQTMRTKIRARVFKTQKNNNLARPKQQKSGTETNNAPGQSFDDRRKPAPGGKPGQA